MDILSEYLSIKGFKYKTCYRHTKVDVYDQDMKHFNAPANDDFFSLLFTSVGAWNDNTWHDIWGMHVLVLATTWQEDGYDLAAVAAQAQGF